MSTIETGAAQSCCSRALNKSELQTKRAPRYVIHIYGNRQFMFRDRNAHQSGENKQKKRRSRATADQRNTRIYIYTLVVCQAKHWHNIMKLLSWNCVASKLRSSVIPIYTYPFPHPWLLFIPRFPEFRDATPIRMIIVKKEAIENQDPWIHTRVTNPHYDRHPTRSKSRHVTRPVFHLPTPIILRRNDRHVTRATIHACVGASGGRAK